MTQLPSPYVHGRWYRNNVLMSLDEDLASIERTFDSAVKAMEEDRDRRDHVWQHSDIGKVCTDRMLRLQRLITVQRKLRDEITEYLKEDV